MCGAETIATFPSLYDETSAKVKLQENKLVLTLLFELLVQRCYWPESQKERCVFSCYNDVFVFLLQVFQPRVYSCLKTQNSLYLLIYAW